MKNVLPLLLLLAACAGGEAKVKGETTTEDTDTSVDTDEPIDTETTSSTTETGDTAPPLPDPVVEVFEVDDPGVVDILFVVDDSCSMYDEQAELASSVINFFYALADGDYHMGVVTTDMDAPNKSGKLQEYTGHKWVENATPNGEAVLTNMLLQGTSGSGTEKGIYATYGALELKDTSDNAGFRRPGSQLHTIVLTDEDDQTRDVEIGPTEFVDWFGMLAQEHPVTEFHTIVHSTQPIAPGETMGRKYLAANTAIGGQVYDIKEPIAETAEALGAHLNQTRTYCPSQLPEPASLVVNLLHLADGPTPTTNYELHEASGCVVLDELPGDGFTQVELSYQPL